jgi:hypothetical protein
MFKLIAELIGLASKADEKEDSVFFSDRRYTSVPIDKSRFSPPDVILGSSPKIAFCDGGSCEIFSSPSVSLQLIRGYFSVFHGNKKISFGLKSFYLLVSAGESAEGALRYSCRFFSKDGLELSNSEICALFGISDENSGAFFSETGGFSFDPLDKSITSGIERAKPSRVADIIRRYFELSIAVFSLSKIGKDDFIVLDGTLQCAFPGESYFLDALYEMAGKKGVYVCALAKTSSLITKRGKSLVPLLVEMSPISEWCYYPLVKIENPLHKAEMYVLKLNSGSNYAFRFEVCSSIKSDVPRIINALQSNSRDYSFPGYPYGLIDADKFAQVTNEEKSSLRAMLFSESGRSSLRLLGLEASLDAHGILNRF